MIPSDEDAITSMTRATYTHTQQSATHATRWILFGEPGTGADRLQTQPSCSRKRAPISRSGGGAINDVRGRDEGALVVTKDF